MAANKLVGLTLSIGGDTTALTTALRDVNKVVKNVQSELREVDRLLKVDPGNVTLLTQKEKLLGDAIGENKKKLETLREAARQAQEQLNQGKITQEQFRALQVEIAKTEQALEKLEKQSKEFGTTFKQQMEAAGEKVKEVGDKISGVGEKLMPLSAILAGLGAAALKYGSDEQEAINKVEASFKDAADSVKEFAETSLKTYGIARGTALDMAALFGDMGTSMGLTTKEAAKMSTALVGLAGDIASFKNVSLDQVQTALKSIFTGETESLKNLGVVMTQANLDAYALANGYNKVTKEMTEAEKVMLRYEYVLNATRNAQGDFARNINESLSVNLTIAKESVKELAAGFGQLLIPVIVPVIQGITGIIQKINDMDDGMKNTILIIGGVVLAIGPLLVVIGKMISTIGLAVQAVGALSNALTFLAAHPVGAAIAAIGVFITCLATQIATQNSAQKAVSEYNNAMDAANKTAEKTISNTEAEIVLLRSKAERYEELRTQVNRNAEEEAELKLIAEELQDTYLNDIVLIDEKTGAYNALGNAIDKVIEKMRIEAQFNATKSIYEEAIRQRIELNNQLAEAQKKAESINPEDWWYAPLKGAIDEIKEITGYQDLNKAIEENEKLIERMEGEYLSAYQDYAKNVSSTANDIAESQAKANGKNIDDFKSWLELRKKQLALGMMSEEQYYEGMKNMLSTYTNEQFGEYHEYFAQIHRFEKQQEEKRLAEQEKSNNERLSAQKRAQDEQLKIQKEHLQAMTDAQKKAFSEWTANANAALDEYSKSLNGILSARDSMREKLAGFSELYIFDTDDYGNESFRLKDTISQMKEYENALKSLRDAGASSEFMNYFMDKDIESAVKLFKAIDSGVGINQYLQHWQKTQDEAKRISSEYYQGELDTLETEFIDKFGGILKQMPKDMNLVGKDAMEGFIDGLKSKLQSAQDTAKLIASAVVKAYNDRLEIRSPSRVMRRSGKDTIIGVIEGIEEQRKNLIAKTKQAADTISTAFKASATPKLQLAPSAGYSNTSTTNIDRSTSINMPVNFYSPKAINEYEAMRQLNKMLQITKAR